MNDYNVSLEKSLPHFHFAHHIFHIDFPGSNPGLCGDRPETNRHSHSMTLADV
jgi:hypothetical protein